MKMLILEAVLFFTLNFDCTNSEVIVQTHYGKILGEVLLNWDHEEFYSFQSIPYAKPPINELRFKAPQKPKPWKDFLNGTIPSPFCPQFYFNDLIGQEDCLYLNVYTKSIDCNSKHPVMVYIHGGGYYVGSGNSLTYGPEFLMTEDIVLVTIDYRLGYLGALSFEDQTQGVPGNAHLKDQVMALVWVQENIENFGGDKQLVTIFGESVGGASVHMHMLSPMSQGLVHRVIAQSGCALNSWNRGALGTGEQIANQLGIIGNDTAEIITKLQQIPMKEFVNQTQKPGELGVRVDVPVLYSPVVETQTNEPAFLPKPIIDLFSNLSNNVPLLLGYNNNDTLIFQVTKRMYTGRQFFFTNINETIPSDLNLTREERDTLISSISDTFFNSQPPKLATNIGAISEYAFGPWLVAGYLQSIQKHLEAHTDLYFYQFSSDSRLNFYKRQHPISATYTGSSHMDELGYLFRTAMMTCFKPNSIEDKSFRQTVKVWTNFAKYGKLMTDQDSVEISKVTDLNNIVYMNIMNDKVEQQNEPHKRVWDFWREVYATYKRVQN